VGDGDGLVRASLICGQLAISNRPKEGKSMSKTLVLDDDEDLRFLLCEAVASQPHCECVAVGSLADLIAHEQEALGCDLAILDVNLGVGTPNGLDALEWLRAHHFQGRIVLLTGHARSHPLVERARTMSAVPVLEKPVSLETILALVSDPRRE
jgi:DNA-binding NtrC family response regulator